LHSTTPQTREEEAILKAVLFFSFEIIGVKDVAILASSWCDLAKACFFFFIGGKAQKLFQLEKVGAHR
jgi:hypothetical protein